MFDKQRYDSPPVYSPPFTSPSNNGFGPPGSFHGPQSDYNAYPPPPGSYYAEDRPQHFYKWLSPPGIIKAMMGTVIVLCVAIFACVASTLMWEMQYGLGLGYGNGYGGTYGSGFGSYGGYGNVGGYGGYGSYGSNYGSYVSPYSAKTAMIAMAAINFIGAMAFFIASFSKSNAVRSRKFFLALLISSVIMAALQVRLIHSRWFPYLYAAPPLCLWHHINLGVEQESNILLNCDRRLFPSICVWYNVSCFLATVIDYIILLYCFFQYDK